MGTWNCSADNQATEPPVAEADAAETLEVPWETGFEDGYCGYAKAGGFCYANPEASYDLVTSPVHSGRHAAAFQVAGDYPTVDGLQARCARAGQLPQAAYYGAWFYVPVEVTSTDNWNLFHFDGNGADVHHDLWDVSLAVTGGVLRAYVFDFLRMMVRATGSQADVPVGEWFHLEVYWERAKDATGTFALYVDGVEALSLTDLSTDDSDAGAEWYVGNLATEVAPRPNTLYVDDVTISATRRGGN